MRVAVARAFSPRHGEVNDIHPTQKAVENTPKYASVSRPRQDDSDTHTEAIANDTAFAGATRLKFFGLAVGLKLIEPPFDFV
jgi:hypothetical protein